MMAPWHGADGHQYFSWRMKLPSGFFVISWRPSDTQLVPAHLAATPPSAITLFRSVKSILRFPALTASTSLKHHDQMIHQAQR
jgi:hypothetical protein